MSVVRESGWRCILERKRIESLAKERLASLIAMTEGHALALCMCSQCYALRRFVEER